MPPLGCSAGSSRDGCCVAGRGGSRCCRSSRSWRLASLGVVLLSVIMERAGAAGGRPVRSRRSSSGWGSRSAALARSSSVSFSSRTASHSLRRCRLASSSSEPCSVRPTTQARLSVGLGLRRSSPRPSRWSTSRVIDGARTCSYAASSPICSSPSRSSTPIADSCAGRQLLGVGARLPQVPGQPEHRWAQLTGQLQDRLVRGHDSTILLSNAKYNSGDAPLSLADAPTAVGA